MDDFSKVFWDELYKKWTVTRKTKDWYSITCKKGLWRVDSRSKEFAEREARRYFAQYFTDGEYSKP